MMRLYGRAATGPSDREPDGQGSHDDGDARGKSPRNAYGFDLHAGVHTGAHERSRLERLCRYLLRPPLSNDRLSEAGPGRYAVRLKTPWRDGTIGIVLDGVELLGRLAVLIPPPRVRTIRYFGVLAPHAKLRPLVVPRGKAAKSNSCEKHGSDSDEPTPGQKRRRIAWAELLRRVWEVDVLACPRCHGRLQHVTVLTNPASIRRLVAGVTAAVGPP